MRPPLLRPSVTDQARQPDVSVTAALVLRMTALLLALAGCKPAPESIIPAPSRSAVVVDLERYTRQQIGRPFTDKPWITHVAAIDLDRDGRDDIVACDARLNAVIWLRQTAPANFEETILAEGVSGPVRVEPVDLDGDGDLDLLLACMGEIFPNNERIGAIFLLENDGHQRFTRRLIADRIARVTDVRAGDFDGDGLLDLATAQFGYAQGEVAWWRNLGNGHFESRPLLNLSGAINVLVADFNGDRTLDLVAVLSQQWEEIHLFENDGSGRFSTRIIHGSPNQDYGSSGISLCDLNRDGRPDILYTNGDGMDYAAPGKRPWHGLQWLENLGGGAFRFHRIGDLAGAYSPVGVDLEGRGVMDIVCTSAYNNWQDPAAAALVVFRNDGRMNFTPHVIARAPIQLITCAAGRFDDSGRPSLVTGGFHTYPPYDRMSRLTLWRPQIRSQP